MVDIGILLIIPVCSFFCLAIQDGCNLLPSLTTVLLCVLGVAVLVCIGRLVGRVEVVDVAGVVCHVWEEEV